MLTEGYAACALDLLAKGRVAGAFRKPKNRRWLRNDADFEPLRARKPFQKFLAGLEGDKPRPAP